METWTDSELVFEGQVVRLRVGEVALDDGTPAYREVVEHDGGVCVLPFTGESLIFVRQYRIALEQDVLEAPAGKLEPNETAAERARIELEEETGYLAETIVPVGHVFGSVGFCTEKIHLYLALDLTKTEQRLEPEERIELVELSLEEARVLLAGHELVDAKTVALLQRFFAYWDARAKGA